MRIISKTKDYYDGVMGMGIDYECPYIREKQEIVIDKTEPHIYINAWKRGMEVNGHIYDIENCKIREWQKQPFEERGYFLIGFCGKIYPCVRIEDINKNVKYLYNKVTENKDVEFRRYHMGTEVNFFDKDWSAFEKYFIEYKTPVFTVRPEKFNMEYLRTKVLILNDELKQYDFMKIKDPYTAFQEIYMYISGILGVNQRPMIQLSDEQIKAKHGFNHKYSFKKEPKNLK